MLAGPPPLWAQCCQCFPTMVGGIRTPNEADTPLTFIAWTEHGDIQDESGAESGPIRGVRGDIQTGYPQFHWPVGSRCCRAACSISSLQKAALTRPYFGLQGRQGAQPRKGACARLFAMQHYPYMVPNGHFSGPQ